MELGEHSNKFIAKIRRFVKRVDDAAGDVKAVEKPNRKPRKKKLKRKRAPDAENPSRKHTKRKRAPDADGSHLLGKINNNPADRCNVTWLCGEEVERVPESEPKPESKPESELESDPGVSATRHTKVITDFAFAVGSFVAAVKRGANDAPAGQRSVPRYVRTRFKDIRQDLIPALLECCAAAAWA